MGGLLVKESNSKTASAYSNAQILTVETSKGTTLTIKRPGLKTLKEMKSSIPFSWFELFGLNSKCCNEAILAAYVTNGSYQCLAANSGTVRLQIKDSLRRARMLL